MSKKKTVDLTEFDQETVDFYVEETKAYRALALDHIKLNEETLKDSKENLAYFEKALRKSEDPEDRAQLEDSIARSHTLIKDLREHNAKLRSSVETFDGVLQMIERSLDQKDQ